MGGFVGMGGMGMTQHWELGVQRDSMQLQQLRQSQAGGTPGLLAGDALLGQLEHINDEIASMEDTIEYRADNLVRDVGRPGAATSTSLTHQSVIDSSIQFSRVYQLHRTPHAPYAVLYLTPMHG